MPSGSGRPPTTRARLTSLARPSSKPRGYKRLNLQGRLRARRLLGVDLDLYGDVINALDWGSDLHFDSVSQTVARFQERRSLRIGLEYRH